MIHHDEIMKSPRDKTSVPSIVRLKKKTLSFGTNNQLLIFCFVFIVL